VLLGLRNGQGTFQCADYNYKGCLFDLGSFVNGKKQGQGVLITKQGQTYEGSFYDDFKHGKGIQKYPDGNFYNGEWKLNKK
jgi:hypothetical protein